MPRPFFLRFDQPQLFCSGQLLDLQLPPEGGAFIRLRFPIPERHRQAAAGVFGAPAAVVDRKPCLRVPGNAGIEGAVGAFQQIHLVGAGISGSQ